jgi:mRNA interferase RelE/StbE
MSYTVRFDSRTRKTLDRLPGDMQSRVMRKLDALQLDPRPFGVEKLAGTECLYRVRVGDWLPRCAH